MRTPRRVEYHRFVQHAALSCLCRETMTMLFVAIFDQKRPVAPVRFKRARRQLVAELPTMISSSFEVPLQLLFDHCPRFGFDIGDEPVNRYRFASVGKHSCNELWR